jgi:adenylate cyclase
MLYPSFVSRWQEPHLHGVAILCALCTAAVLILHASYVPFQRTENQARDLVFSIPKISRRAEVDPRLVYVAIDDETLSMGSLGPDDFAASPALQRMASGWPWPRDFYPLLIDRLMQAGASVVALDILFPIPRDGDPALKAALDKYHDRIVIGSNFVDDPTAGSRRTYTVPSKDLIPDSQTDDRVGYVNFWPDTDGVIRTVKYRMSQAEAFRTADNGRVYYSLAARVLQKLGLGDTVPAALRGLRFAPPQSADGFQPIPLYTLFLPKFWANNFMNGTFFKNKIVVVGPYGNSQKDQLPTPFGLMDGPELHLNAINEALHHDFVSIPSEKEIALLIVAMGFAAFGVSSILHRPLTLALTLVFATCGYFVFTLVGFNYFHRVIPFLGPLLTFDAGSALSLYWKWLLERRERARMRRIFERFVSKNVVKEVVENRSSYLHQLGGVRKSVVILMTDLRGFTTLTEEADSTQLVAQLNEYFTAMVDCIFATNGTVDKFVGDAILAVWGNIHSNGAISDGILAVKTALAMLKSLDKLNEEWVPRGWPALKMGVGVNFGDVIFGAIGSEQKAEPTVIGDAVNSASRLEGLTKEYGVDLLIGQSVAELVDADFHLQLVDYVRMKGKMRAMKVYAVLGPKSETLDREMTAYLEKYNAGMGCYERAEFDVACSQFRDALYFKPEDPVATVYMERCHELAEQKPEAWDGVFVMKTK